MLTLEIIQGSRADWVIQGALRKTLPGTTPTGFLSTDTLSAKLWAGQDVTTAATPTVSWSSSSACQISVSIPAATSATLEALGDYRLQVWVTRGSDTACLVDASVRVLPAPGTGTQTVTPYCAYRDLLDEAAWVERVANLDSDQEGFYRQRLRAREWLDWLIVRSWRGTSSAYFGDAGRSAQYWLGSWVRRTPMPSKWLIDQLAANTLLIRPWVTQACAWKSISLIGLSQIGVNDQLAARGAYYRDQASALVNSQTAELDLNADGVADLPIPIGITNTIYT